MPLEYEPEVREALKQARVLLSSVKDADATQEDGAAGRVLECAFRLLESVFVSIESGKSVTLSPSDSTVVKAVLELVVRWGIYPHLSLGVGIPLEKRFGGKSAAAAAAAMHKHVSGGEASGALKALDREFEPPVQPTTVEPTTLLQSAELLASLVLDTPQRRASLSSNTEESSSGTMGQQFSSRQGNPIEQETHAKSEEGEKQDEKTVFPAAALHQLVIFYHLSDLCAAYIQLTTAGKMDWGKLALERLDEMVKFLPVAHMIEALLTLLGQSNPDPPSWLKEKAGKLLSKLLMRDGGVAAAMERLVGGTQTGNVKAYERIALHLAKVPKYVATTREYYEAVCPQLPPLFLSPLPKEGGPKEGTLAARMVINVHHTAIIMACKLAARAPRLCEEYLLVPLLRPLLEWGVRVTAHTKLEAGTKTGDIKNVAFQEIVADSALQITQVGQGHDHLEEATETSLVDALIATHIFMTAGHDGAECIREALVQLIEPLSSLLMSINVLLAPSSGQYAHGQLDNDQATCSLRSTHADAGAQGAARQAPSSGQYAHGQLDNDQATCSLRSTHADAGAQGAARQEKPAFQKGFLKNQSLGFADANSQAEGSMGVIDRLRAAVSDTTETLIDGSSLLSASLVGLDVVTMEWPRHTGEIWEALEAGRRRALTV